MKKTFGIAVLVYAFMLLLPLSALGKTFPTSGETPVSVPTQAVKTDNNVKMDIFRVLDKKSGKITEMTAEDYIFGVVAAEMPVSYGKEALKAQAVASYTYACYKRENNKTKEYDITTDYTVDQSFKTKEQAMSDWGKKAEEYTLKIESAIKETEWQVLRYNGKPILAVYHALSCGNTYNAKEVWGKEIPYLQSVSCAGDKLDADFVSTKSFKKEELKEKFISKLENTFDSKEVIGEISKTKSGLVKSVNVFGKEFTGADIRGILGLASSNFSCAKKNGEYKFTVYGYGHGVGMSQNAANYMAKQGYSYKEILMHFYKGVRLEK